MVDVPISTPTVTIDENEVRLIDTHCHLDDPTYADDLQAVLDESRAKGVQTWINVGFEPNRWGSSISLARSIPGMFVMLGIHPSSAQEWSTELARELEHLLESESAVAIGEIGLDFLHDTPSTETQISAFEGQLDLALQMGLPAVIHMRASESTMLDVLGQRGKNPQLLFHSFDGGPRLTDYIIETGAFVGVGGLATKSKSDLLREQLIRIPLEQMVLETDSPYLIPAKARGRRNTPGNVRTIARFLATLTGETDTIVASTTTRNANLVFEGLRHA